MLSNADLSRIVLTLDAGFAPVAHAAFVAVGPSSKGRTLFALASVVLDGVEHAIDLSSAGFVLERHAPHAELFQRSLDAGYVECDRMRAGMIVVLSVRGERTIGGALIRPERSSEAPSLSDHASVPAYPLIIEADDPAELAAFMRHRCLRRQTPETCAA